MPRHAFALSLQERRRSAQHTAEPAPARRPDRLDARARVHAAERARHRAPRRRLRLWRPPPLRGPAGHPHRHRPLGRGGARIRGSVLLVPIQGSAAAARAALSALPHGAAVAAAASAPPSRGTCFRRATWIMRTRTCACRQSRAHIHETTHVAAHRTLCSVPAQNRSKSCNVCVCVVACRCAS